jgi:hypothetical protein
MGLSRVGGLECRRASPGSFTAGGYLSVRLSFVSMATAGLGSSASARIEAIASERVEVAMSADDAALVGNGYAAAVHGDIEPLVALFDPGLVWRGVERGVVVAARAWLTWS